MGAKFYNESLWCWDKNQWESRGPGAFTMSWYIWPLLQRSIIRTSDVALTKFNNERRSRESRNSCASLFGNHILIYLLPSPMTRLYYNKLFSFEWTSRASNCTTHNYWIYTNFLWVFKMLYAQINHSVRRHFFKKLNNKKKSSNTWYIVVGEI